MLRLTTFLLFDGNCAEAMTFYSSCFGGAHFDELRAIFAKLSDGPGPELRVDLKDMPFGIYGRLTDRYGVEWFFRGEAAAS